MSDYDALLSRCYEMGIPTGSRCICTDKEYTNKTDYDFVMTDRDFYRAFTDAQIDVFEMSDTSGTSIRTKLTEEAGGRARFGDFLIDVIVVGSPKEKEYWKTATEICAKIHEVYSLETKHLRVAMFEDILSHVRTKDLEGYY